MSKSDKIIEKNLKKYTRKCPELDNLYNYFANLAINYIEGVSEVLPEKTQNQEYEKMDIRITLELVREFLGSIDKKYLDIFNKALTDGTFDLFLPEDDLVERPDYPITFPKPKANINIPIYNNIKDGSIIVHEFFHFLNDGEQYNVVAELFTEMISIYFELRFAMFLIEKGYDSVNFSKILYERIDDSYDAANTLFGSSAVLDIYNKTGKINLRNYIFINKFINTYKGKYKLIRETKKTRNISHALNDFESDISYLFGTLISIMAIEEPKIYDLKMKYINNNLNSFNIEDVLYNLDVKLEEYESWIGLCVDKLDKALENIYGENYCNSGSYGSR